MFQNTSHQEIINGYRFSQVEEYNAKLQPLLVETTDGLVLVPELYYVPPEKVCSSIYKVFMSRLVPIH